MSEDYYNKIKAEVGEADRVGMVDKVGTVSMADKVSMMDKVGMAHNVGEAGKMYEKGEVEKMLIKIEYKAKKMPIRIGKERRERRESECMQCVEGNSQWRWRRL